MCWIRVGAKLWRKVAWKGRAYPPLLYTNACTSKDPSVKLLKFTDDTTLIALIQDGDESAYRQEIIELFVWCSYNNLELNTLKTVEMIVICPPPLVSPTQHHEQHCGCSRDIQIPEHHQLSGPEVGVPHWLHCQEGPVEAVPSLVEEVQTATWAAHTVLLCSHWICRLHL